MINLIALQKEFSSYSPSDLLQRSYLQKENFLQHECYCLFQPDNERRPLAILIQLK